MDLLNKPLIGIHCHREIKEASAWPCDCTPSQKSSANDESLAVVFEITGDRAMLLEPEAIAGPSSK